MKHSIPNENNKKSHETKEKLLHSAGILFKEYGFDHTSVSSIVEHAGVSKGSFYVHFSSKDEIVSYFIGEVIQKTSFDLEALVASFTSLDTATTRFLALLEKLAFCKTEELGYQINKNSALIQINKSIHFETFLNYNKTLHDAVHKIITYGIQTGEFCDCYNIDEITYDCILAIRGFLFEWITRYPDMDLRGCLHNHFTIYLNGLKCSSTTSSLHDTE